MNYQNNHVQTVRISKFFAAWLIMLEFFT